MSHTLDSMTIAGYPAAQFPNGLSVDDEFTLKVRVRVMALTRTRVDVASLSHPDAVVGALHADLVTVTRPEIEQ